MASRGNTMPETLLFFISWLAILLSSCDILISSMVFTGIFSLSRDIQGIPFCQLLCGPVSFTSAWRGPISAMFKADSMWYHWEGLENLLISTTQFRTVTFRGRVSRFIQKSVILESVMYIADLNWLPKLNLAVCAKCVARTAALNSPFGIVCSLTNLLLAEMSCEEKSPFFLFTLP